MISAKDIEVLRSIARAGGDYEEIKRALAPTGWDIEEDDIDLGFLRIFIPVPDHHEWRLIIAYRDPKYPPSALLTFSVFPDLEESITEFNAAFRSVGNAISQHLGTPTVSGERRSSSRTWPYSYQRWSLPEGEFTLVQDEFDLLDGMDVTLWIQPVDTPIE